MSDFDDEEWELSHDNSHPNAIRLLTEDFYWNIADDNSPFGTDSGLETFATFQKWRKEHPTANPIEFLGKLLDEWQFTNDFWDVTDVVIAEQLWLYDEFSFMVRDDAVIALAFGQLIIEGEVDAEVKRRALLAIKRQSFPTMVKMSACFEDERVERLEKMKTVLEKV